MKGRTTCPKCKHEFVLDVPDNINEYEALCPECSNKFIIDTTSCKPDSEECSWEEHGEPRKTILSSIKPKTDKPMIAAILLAAVFALGITTAAFSETFIETSLDTLSSVGMNGTMELSITNTSNISLENVIVTIDDTPYGGTDKEGVIYVENVTLGARTVELSLSDYKTLKREILVTPFITSYHEITMEEGAGEEHVPFDTIGCSTIIAIFSVFALMGALACLKRKHLDVAVIGSLIGIFSFGFLLIGSVVSVAAFVIIIMCREEFENGKKGKIF